MLSSYIHLCQLSYKDVLWQFHKTFTGNIIDLKYYVTFYFQATTMSSRKTKGKLVKKRAQRATSNVFAFFDKAQIEEFKEAFKMIDQNGDGFIDKEDLHDMLASLG